MQAEEGKEYPLFEDYSIEYRKSIKSICDTWDGYSREDIFLRSKYLQTLENFPPTGMQFRYVCVLKNGKAIGILYFQLIKIDLADSLRETSSGKGIFSRISGWFKSLLASFFETHVLISGNSLVTGDYAYHFKSELAPKLVFKIIDASLDVLRNNLKNEGIKVGVELKKDYYKVQLFSEDQVINQYAKFEVQPNMVMSIDPAWNTFEDYLAAMKSKYRVRVRRAFKKSKDLTKREMSEDEIIYFKDEMHRQYLETVAGAGFNLFYLRDDYFLELKKTFQEDFTVTGFFLGEQLVGYYTTFFNYNDMEAHFLGYDHKLNEKYQTYLNFLFDMVDVGIKKGVGNLHLSRTAMEIKSSVGAKGIPLSVFIKHNTRFINRWMPRALDYFVPPVVWQPRTPFK